MDAKNLPSPRTALTILLLITALLMPNTPSARAHPAATAKTYIVTTRTDPGDGTCDTTECTLREAIAAANANPGKDTINFDMPYLDVAYPVITPGTPLPPVTDPVVIDGSTQEPYSHTSLHGSGGISWGLSIKAGDSTVKSMGIGHFNGPGVLLESADANVIRENFLGSNEYGVLIATSSSNNTIERNIINHNEKDGIAILGDSKGNTLYQNSIYDNRGLGIDLGDDGVTQNDVEDKDTDGGANRLQNYPVLTLVRSDLVQGHVLSTPNTAFRVDCYGNDLLDDTGHGEGKRYLESDDLATTNEDGIGAFEVRFDDAANISCTATNLSTGDTSEFSGSSEMVINSAGDAADQLPGTDGCDTGRTVTLNGQEQAECTLRAAIQEANATPRADKIMVLWDREPLEIQLRSPLPALAEGMNIDGLTRPAGVIVDASGVNDADAHGLHVRASDATVQGLTIKNAPKDGIRAEASVHGKNLHIVGSGGHGIFAGLNVTVFGTDNQITESGAAGVETKAGGVAFDAVTINGNDGWGIYSAGEVQINASETYDVMSEVSENAKGGIRGLGTVKLARIEVVENEGGSGIWVSSHGTVIIKGEGNDLSSNSGSGIRAPLTDVQITGSARVSENGKMGIYARSVGGRGDVEASHNGDHGIWAHDHSIIVGKATVVSNGDRGSGHGLFAHDHVLIYGEGSDILSNEESGIFAANGVVFIEADARVVGNGETGIYGWALKTEGDIEVTHNAWHGIWAFRDSVLIGGQATVLRNGEEFKQQGFGHGISSRLSITIEGEGSDISHNAQSGLFAPNGTVCVHVATVSHNQKYGIDARHVDLDGVEIHSNVLGGVSAIDAGEAEAVAAGSLRRLVDGGAPSTINGSTIEDNLGDGIRYGGPADLTVRRSNVVSNAGMGIHNLLPLPTIEAQGNWWGDPSGPGGDGLGSGDEVSGSIDYAAWATQEIALVAVPDAAPLYAARGVTTANSIYVRNWTEPTDTVTITVDDTQGWLSAGYPIKRTLDDVGADVPVSVTLPATLSLGATGDVTFTVVSAASPTVSDTATYQVVAAAVADLSVETTGPNLAWLSTPFTRTLLVANAGPDDATDVALTATLSSTLSTVSLEPSQGHCTPLDGSFTCALGTIPAGAQLSVTAAFTTATAGTFTNYVEVSASEPDPEEANDTHIACVTVEPLTPVAGVALDGPTEGRVNTHYGFTATVTPITSTTPVTYVWEATEHDHPIVYRSIVSNTAYFSWRTGGLHTVTVTATNWAGEMASKAQTIGIKRYTYLPLVLRHQ